MFLKVTKCFFKSFIKTPLPYVICAFSVLNLKHPEFRSREICIILLHIHFRQLSSFACDCITTGKVLLFSINSYISPAPLKGKRNANHTEHWKQ